MRATSAAVRRARPLLGTRVEISAQGRAANEAIDRAFAAVERVHHAMSRQESTSDIARLRSGHRAALDPWTRCVLDRAEELRLATDRLFDCASCDYSLDGIAKGFAVDRAIDCLRDAGMTAGVVNAGGDLRVFGDEWQPLHVRSGAALIYVGKIRETAVATSAGTGLVHPLGGKVRVAGVTVMAADCMTADALTKPCMLEPEQAAVAAERLAARVLRSA
ncbi:MAG TPA: FAD:protein FMN transferase [Burkholderiales bacterium]|nr:FAD:protein FMN transferase [Burkholderiales bacterium]